MTLILQGTDNSVSSPAVQGGTAGTTSGLYYPASNYVGIATAGVQGMVINDTQDVGFGTATPYSANGTNVEIANSTVARLLLRQTGTRLWSIGAGSNTINIYDETADAERFKIDSSGRVNMPYQTYFYQVGDGTLYSTAQVIKLGTNRFNVGSNYNTGTGVFTAPVAGVYMIGAFAITGPSTTKVEMFIRKNGTDYFQVRYTDGAPTGNYMQFGNAVPIKLAANDTIDWYLSSTTGSSPGIQGNDKEIGFWGYLLG